MVFSAILNDEGMLANLQSFGSGLQIVAPFPRYAKLLCLSFILSKSMPSEE